MTEQEVAKLPEMKLLKELRSQNLTDTQITYILNAYQKLSELAHKEFSSS